MAIRKIKTKAGRTIELDGDLIPILESLYQDVAVASGFEHDFLDMRREIENFTGQLTPKELRDYFMNSLFLNCVSYENEMAERILENIARTKAAQTKVAGRSSRTTRTASRGRTRAPGRTKKAKARAR